MHQSGTTWKVPPTMPKPPPDRRQSTLFPFDNDDSPTPVNSVTSTIEGDDHALQDDSSRTPAATDGTARATAADTQAETDARNLRQGTQGEPRSLEGPIVPGQAGERPDPDRQRSPGTGSAGTAGSFIERILAAGLRRVTLPRRGDGPHQNSHVARLKSSRRQQNLFDAPPQKPSSVDGSSAAPAPTGATDDGTLISPPGRASGIPVPPVGLPQNSAGTEAPPAEPRTGADSGASRQAPAAGPPTPEGDPTVEIGFQSLRRLPNDVECRAICRFSHLDASANVEKFGIRRQKLVEVPLRHDADNSPLGMPERGPQKRFIRSTTSDSQQRAQTVQADNQIREFGKILQQCHESRPALIGSDVVHVNPQDPTFLQERDISACRPPRKLPNQC